MQITDDIYNDLSKRIEAGEFLSSSKDNKTTSENNPSLPVPQNSDEADFHEKCQQTIDLYAKKIEAQKAQLASINLIVQEKEATDRVSSLVKDFDSMLEQQYKAYKAEAEQTISQLKSDLNQMKSVAQDALQRNKDLSLSYKNLEDINRKLKIKLDELESELAYNEQGLPYVLEIEDLETNTKHKKLLTGSGRGNKVGKLVEDLENKKSEIARLIQECDNAKKQVPAFAVDIVDCEMKRLTNIDLIPQGMTGDMLAIEKDTVLRLISQVFKKYLPKSEGLVGELLMKISDLQTIRDQAEIEKINKEKKQPHEKLADQMNFSIGGEQKNTLKSTEGMEKARQLIDNLLKTNTNKKEDEQ